MIIFKTLEWQASCFNCNGWGLGFISTTTSTALVGYLFSSFGRVLDLKSRGPRFNSCLGWIVNFYISSLSCYTIMEIFVQVLFFNYCKVLLSPKYHPFSLLFEQFDFWSAKKMLGPESLSKWEFIASNHRWHYLFNFAYLSVDINHKTTFNLKIIFLVFTHIT